MGHLYDEQYNGYYRKQIVILVNKVELLKLILINDVTNLPEDIQARLSELSKKLHAGEADAAGQDINSLVDALDEGQVRDAIDDVVSLNYAIAAAHVLGGPNS